MRNTTSDVQYRTAAVGIEQLCVIFTGQEVAHETGDVSVQVMQGFRKIYPDHRDLELVRLQ